MKPLPFRAMTVAGIMSGTSADGVDVALVRIHPQRGKLKLDLITHRAFPFTRLLRGAVLAAMDAKATSTAELARLNWRLGQAYAEAVRDTLKKHPAKLDLIGCHGQTIYHQAAPSTYAGRGVACTWQIGEPALLAAEIGAPVVSNFRPADMVAGGQGAPLVPLLDYVCFAHHTRARVLQNIGGIANLTAIPAGAGIEEVIAFDTGPGNMVIDAVVQKLFGKQFDRGGKIGSQGRVLEEVISSILKERFFTATPPKSAGREQFGAAFVERFVSICNRHGSNSQDVVATATALTAQSIAQSYKRFVAPLFGAMKADYILSGGGAKNATLCGMLRERLEPLGCTVTSSDNAGIPVDAKECVAFALLAYYTWHMRPANVLSATGAERPAILGQITYA